jgi:hypothetical protein
MTAIMVLSCLQESGGRSREPRPETCGGGLVGLLPAIEVWNVGEGSVAFGRLSSPSRSGSPETGSGSAGLGHPRSTI